MRWKRIKQPVHLDAEHSGQPADPYSGSLQFCTLPAWASRGTKRRREQLARQSHDLDNRPSVPLLCPDGGDFRFRCERQSTLFKRRRGHLGDIKRADVCLPDRHQRQGHCRQQWKTLRLWHGAPMKHLVIIAALLATTLSVAAAPMYLVFATQAE